MKKQTLLSVTVLALVLTLSGCQSAYYSAMEKVGVHKRDILIDRVEGNQRLATRVSRRV